MDIFEAISQQVKGIHLMAFITWSKNSIFASQIEVAGVEFNVLVS